MIEADAVHTLLINSLYHHGFVHPDMRLYSEIKCYEAVDLWTDPLGVSGLSETSLAETIAQKNHVKLIQQDFSKGDEPARYELAFGISCGNLSEIEKGLKNLEKTESELATLIEKRVMTY